MRKTLETRFTAERTQALNVTQAQTEVAAACPPWERSSTESPSRIDTLRAAIVEGKYHISSAVIADRLMRRMLLPR